MKRQIDPNLSSNESENILFSDGETKEKTEFKLTEKTPSHGRKHDDVENLLLNNGKSSVKSDSESKSDADSPSKSEEATEHHHSNEHTHSH